MKVVLLSTYDLGHQPFGLASPAAWLADEGAEVACIDLAVESLDEGAVREAGLIALYLPMHTATRLAAKLIPRVIGLNASAHVCCYGLYAPLNEEFPRGLGVRTILGGEFEGELAALARGLMDNGAKAPGGTAVSHAKLRFRVPDRRGLPDLTRYGHVTTAEGDRLVAGYTESSRGCKHLCRHCPVVPVYGGRVRVVDAGVVLADIRNQVAAGARHITFGDPDFFNGPGHAMGLVRALHSEFPDLSYDVTIKVEHILLHARHLRTLSDTGCLFITTAAESVNDRILALLAKGHTRSDFIRAIALTRDAGVFLSPTFIPFTPWSSLEDYADLLDLLAELDMTGHVAPVQLTMRLLVTKGSRLFDIPGFRDLLGDFDPGTLGYGWAHPDPRVDALQVRVRRAVEEGEGSRDTFAELWRIAGDALGRPPSGPPPAGRAQSSVPSADEPWYCCAEPTDGQFAQI